MSKKKQNKKKKQTVVSVEVNKNKSNKALESFIGSTLVIWDYWFGMHSQP